jgi:hypothetical protein
MPEPAEPAPAAVEPAAPQADPDLGDAGKKAIAAERSARSAAEKEAKSLRTQLDAIEAAKLSDLEKAQKENATLASEAAQARAEALRFRIASKHGISDEDAQIFLTGSDEQTITAQATRLAALTAAKETRPGPRADLSQGPKANPATGSKGQLFAAWLDTQQAG